MKLHISKHNETYIKIDCEKSVAYELSGHFCFYVKNHEFNPKFKKKKWDGKIRLFNIGSGLIYRGLYNDVLAFAEERGYEVISTYKPANHPVSNEMAQSIYDRINSIHKPFDHQVSALALAMAHENAFIVSPTSSGKSYLIYHLMRVFLEFGRGLIVVPTKNLVSQLYKDFKEYSTTNGFDVDENIHYIYSGQEKYVKKPLTISTWQSIQKEPPEFFEDYDFIIGDEAHHFQAKCLKYIMENCTNARFRIGLTGSTDETEVNDLTLTGLFGPKHEVIQTHELMERGEVADLEVRIITMRHKPDPEFLKMQYIKQVEWLSNNESRNRFIRRVVAGEKGNKLVLFHLVEKHGEILYHQFKEDYPDKEIYFIHGGVDLAEREKIRQRLSQTDDAILIASYNTYSTGMNVPSLRHVFSTMPGKARIKLLQSIGRVLRLSKGKTKAVFWDFADYMEHGGKVNMGFNHLEERMNIYVSQKFKIKFIEVDLK